MNNHEGLTRRPEYTLENMGRVFTVLKAFNIKLTPEEEFEYDQIFCTIDFFDQLIDNEKIPPETTIQVLSFLTGEQDTLPPEISQNVEENFSFFRSIVSKKDIGPQLELTARQLLLLHNQLYTAHSVTDYIELVKEEAVKSAEMAFLFSRELPPTVKEFLTQANILGGLTDTLLDLESDFIENQISIKPSRSLRFALKLEIAKQLAILSWNYPKKQELPGLTKKYISILATPNPQPQHKTD